MEGLCREGCCALGLLSLSRARWRSAPSPARCLPGGSADAGSGAGGSPCHGAGGPCEARSSRSTALAETSV